MSIPPLATPRLLIREYAPADLDARHALMAEAFDSTDTPEDTRRWLDWTVASYRELARLYQPPYGDYAVTRREDGAVIGAVGLAPARIPWDVLVPQDMRGGGPQPALVTPEFGLFWAIRAEHQGQGYATEAARALVAHLFDGLLIRRLVATTEHDNLASQAVMRKLGMTLHRNPGPEPAWCQVVGVLDHPHLTL